MGMPRSPKQNTKIREETRQALLTAATKVFMRMGFAATRMADIAREAGLSHGLTYHYFANKDAVFTAAIETSMAFASQMIQAAATNSEQQPIERLRTVCAFMLDGARNNPAYPLIMLQAASSGATPAQARTVLRRASRRTATILAKLIADAQRTGQIGGGDPAVLARTVLATVSGLVATPPLGPSTAPFPSVDILMRLFGAAAGN
jgi:AcrR family transcriptional regulator